MPELAVEFVKAAKKNHVPALRAIAAADPSLVHLTDGEGATPLHHAAWKGNLEAVQVLLELGADVNALSANTHYGGSPLHAAAHGNQKEVAACLIAAGADVKAVSCNGRTPLEETTLHKATAVARLLREHGAEA